MPNINPLESVRLKPLMATLFCLLTAPLKLELETELESSHLDSEGIVISLFCGGFQRLRVTMPLTGVGGGCAALDRYGLRQHFVRPEAKALLLLGRGVKGQGSGKGRVLFSLN